MNFDTEIQTHSDWKTKFRAVIRARGRFDAATVGDDHRCPLGQWLHGEAQAKYGDLASYRDCVSAHAGFHREAGRVAGLINAHDYTSAEQALAADSLYEQASEAVVRAIVAMKLDSSVRIP